MRPHMLTTRPTAKVQAFGATATFTALLIAALLFFTGGADEEDLIQALVAFLTAFVPIAIGYVRAYFKLPNPWDKVVTEPEVRAPYVSTGADHTVTGTVRTGSYEPAPPPPPSPFDER